MFYDKKLMDSDELKNIWRAANNVLEHDVINPPLPQSCNKIASLLGFTNDNQQGRLSLRSAAHFCYGSAKMYNIESKKLLTDITKLDKDIWTRRRLYRETTETVTEKVSETPERSLSPVISYPARRRKVISPEYNVMEQQRSQSESGFRRRTESPSQTSLHLSRSVHRASKRESGRRDSERSRSPIISTGRIRQRTSELCSFPGASKHKSELGASGRPRLSQTSTSRIQQKTPQLTRSCGVVSIRRNERKFLEHPKLCQTATKRIEQGTPELSRSCHIGSNRRSEQGSLERPRLSQTSTSRIQQITPELSRSCHIDSKRRSEQGSPERPRLCQTSTSIIQHRTSELSSSGQNCSIQRSEQKTAERPRSTNGSTILRSKEQRALNKSAVNRSQERVTRLQREARSGFLDGKDAIFQITQNSRPCSGSRRTGSGLPFDRTLPWTCCVIFGNSEERIPSHLIFSAINMDYVNDMCDRY